MELCRAIAQKFNNDFKVEDFFKVPEPLIQQEYSRIMSLKDGLRKMSKSEISDLSRINLTDEKDQIINTIKKAKTDSDPIPDSKTKLLNRPEALNLLNIFSDITQTPMEKILDQMAGKDFSFLKKELSDVLVTNICPIGNEIKKLLSDKSHLEAVLKKGKEKAQLKAEENLKKIRDIVGLL